MFVYVCVILFFVIFSLNVFCFLFPLIFHPYLLVLSSYYISQQWLWNFDTKSRFWGFASCIVSMCLFYSFSSPLPQYDSRWWLSSLLSPVTPLSDVTRSSTSVSLSPRHPLFSPLALSTSSACARLIRVCGLVFHLHCLDLRSVKSACMGVFHWCAIFLSRRAH